MHKQVSFFDYDPSIQAYRYIVLTEDDWSLTTYVRSVTDEGWCDVYSRWEYDCETGLVTCDTRHGGRDCDGQTSTSTVCVCAVDRLACRDVYEDGDAEASGSGPMPFRVPEWTERQSSRRDYSAEQAGY